jgi:hypothetical protein
VVVASLAGFGRDRELKKVSTTSGGFRSGLIMTVIAGVLSSFMAFVFVYSQYPIVANLSVVAPGTTIKVTVDSQQGGSSADLLVDEDGRLNFASSSIPVGGLSAWETGLLLMKVGNEPAWVRGYEMTDVRVETGSIPATFGVFAVGLIGGALVNLGYAAYMLTKRRSWNVLLQSGWELALAVLIGVDFSLAVALMGKGMLLLGALGASVGFGIQQAMQMTGTQLLGFISGEWRGVHGKPRLQMYVALGILFVAAVLMAYGNSLAKS